MKLKQLIIKNKIEFNKNFRELLKKKLDKSSLSKAMFYASINGGKRIRPFMVSQASKIAKISKSDAFIIAASIECIHSYSLIHDDLPSMDNDDYRRGKLSTHKKFSESTAILSGDALHDLAFELISGELKNKNLKSKIKLINYLSLCIGHKGLALGQILDLEFENKKINKKSIIEMYKRKTGKLFEYSFAAPFVLANLKENEIKFAKEYGLLFGLIFQIVDDLIDEIGTFKKIGKTPGKDFEQGKSTLLKLLGKDEVIKFCLNEINLFKKKYNDFLKKDSLIELLYLGIKRIN